MKTKTIFTVTAFLLILSAFGQKITVDLTFTAVDSAAYVRLDSIKVMNRTQGDSAKLYWHDTTLSLQINPGDLLLYIGYSTSFPVGFQEINQDDKQFHLFQNYPNPVKDQSKISIYIPEKGTVNLMVTEIQGRVVLTAEFPLDKGNHSFRFTPGDGNLFFLTARWNGVTRSIKILTTGSNSGKRCMLDYTGRGNGESLLKSSSLRSGYMKESGILDTTNANETYTFQFATNIPCLGTPAVSYEGQIYNTIQIFSQCWMKENLNVGTMINGSQNQINDSIIEKHCYNNEADSCTKYGGLYQWDEMMQYTTQPGTQGICPPGWHIPTDEEWKILEGAVDSQYGIGDPRWDESGNRGFDAGTNLKSKNDWVYGGNGIDLFGCSGLPGGFRYSNGGFSSVGYYCDWWASTEGSNNGVYGRVLGYFGPTITRGSTFDKAGSESVRCLRDY